MIKIHIQNVNIELTSKEAHSLIASLIADKDIPQSEIAEIAEIAERGEVNDLPKEDELPFEVNTPSHFKSFSEQFQLELSQSPEEALEFSSIPSRVRALFPPLNSNPTFLYDINEEDDHMKPSFEVPDVEIIDDEYEMEMAEKVKTSNKRYAMYKNSHETD